MSETMTSPRATLADILAHKREEVELKKNMTAPAALARMVQGMRDPAAGQAFLAAITAPAGEARFILEIKPASPSAGLLTQGFRLEPLLEAYNGFANALSVLTDNRYFKGDMQLLEKVVRKSPHPVLCKDFILEPYQVHEARLAGAHAVLLIVKILDDVTLQTLVDEIRDLGMTAVIEVQNPAELQRALAVRPDVLLVNNRNLDTFEVSLETTLALAPSVPEGVVRISASGIASRQDIDRLLPVANVFLIGSSLMRLPVESLPEQLKALTGR